MRRRSWLLGGVSVGGALVLGWGLLPPRQRLVGGNPLPTREGQHALTGWLKIGDDDQVTVVLPRCEMGQGVSTALAMVLADELEADWRQVRTESAPVDGIYNNIAVAVDRLPFAPGDDGWQRLLAEWLTAKAMRDVGLMVTGGSSSVKDLWLPLREAGASARAMLVAAAADEWGVPAAECRAEQGLVKHQTSGRQARFGSLAAAASRQAVPRRVTLKQPADWRLIGRPLLRQDAAAKQDGSARFAMDLHLPDLHYASVLMCPTLGGAVQSFDGKAALAMPGVKLVLQLPSRFGSTGGVAAVADSPWRALQAVRAVAVTWRHGEAAGLDSEAVHKLLTAALDGSPGDSFLKRGDTGVAMARAVRTVEAVYQVPLLAHATLEPQNCTVLFDPAARLAFVWAPTQAPKLARRAAAQVLGLDADQVMLVVTPLGGGFGRRLEVDVVAQAAGVAREMPGVPVQVFWTRDQDTTHDMYRPPCVARWSGALDAEGQLLAVVADSAGPAVLPQFVKRQFGLAFGLGAGAADKTVVEGAFDQSYAWPAARVRHRVVELPLPVGFWRSMGHSHQAFFKECFMDECAHAAGLDPLDFRLRQLREQPRQRLVLQRAAAMAQWGQPAAPTADGAATAWGLALHESFGSIVAQAAQVSLDPADKQRIRVHRVVCAIDCGTVVNPNLVRQQIEGAIVFGLTAALHGEITLKDGQVQQTNFHDQRLLAIDECPAIQTDLILSDLPPQGVGEPGTPPVAPAVANALFWLTGQRLRRLPLRLAAAPGTSPGTSPGTPPGSATGTAPGAAASGPAAAAAAAAKR